MKKLIFWVLWQFEKLIDWLSEKAVKFDEEYENYLRKKKGVKQDG